MKMLIHGQEIDGLLHRIRLSEPVIHADNEAKGRSGHIGHAMTEFAPGKIIAFSANTSGARHLGHSAFGWMEYRISENYGETFGEARVLPFSYEVLLDGLFTVSVEKAVTLSDGSIAAFCLMNSQARASCCEPWDFPRVVISRDGGETWEDAVQVTEYKGRIYDALERDGVVYVLELCNDASEFFYSHKPEHRYRLFRSTDGCRTFEEVSVLPFGEGYAYGDMIFTPEGVLVTYVYNNNDEYRMDYAISHDLGRTWPETGDCFMKNRIRNPQIGLLDGQYILHGRAGEQAGARSQFIFYTSSDGFHWDDGKILIELRHASFYSCNLTVTLPNGRERMLVKYSENYHDPSYDWTGYVNSMMLHIDTVEGIGGMNQC